MLRPGRAVITAALSWSAVSHAGEPLETVSIEYRAAPCGDTATFIERVRERTTRFNLGDDALEIRHFVVEIQASERGYRGELSIVSPGGPLQVRQITAPECEEALEALALMTALAIDPSSPIAPGRERPEERAPPSGLEGGTETDTRDQTPAPPARKVEPEPEPDAEEALGWELGVGAHAVASSGVMPELMFGGQVGIESAWRTGRLVSPALRVLGRYQVGPRVGATAGSASFRLLTAGLELCPLSLLPARRLAFRPCLTADVGTLTGEGSEVENARSAERLFAAIGGAMRAELRVHRALSFDGAVAASFPLRRDRFTIADELVSQADLATIVASLGMSVWLF